MACLLFVALVVPLALGQQQTAVLVATGDQVVVSVPDSKGSSEVLSVGELVNSRAGGGPAVGDKVAVDKTACAAAPLPDSATTGCVVKQTAVFGKVKPLSGLPSVTPVPEATPISYVTVKGRVTYFTSAAVAGATVVITGTANGEPFTLTTQADSTGYYVATVPTSGRYVTTATLDYSEELARQSNAVLNVKFQPSSQRYPGSYVLSGTTAPWFGTASSDDLVSGLVDVAISGGYFVGYYLAASAAVTFRNGATLQVPVFAAILSGSDATQITEGPLITNHPSAVVLGGAKVEIWHADSEIPTPSGSPDSVTYPAGLYLSDTSGKPWFQRASGNFIPPFNGTFSFSVSSGQFKGAYTLYLNGQSVLTGTIPVLTSVDVACVEGSPIPVRLEASSAAPGSLTVIFQMKEYEFTSALANPTFILPDVKISLLAFPRVLSDWSTSLAQAFVRLGPNQRLAIRAPTNAPAIPAVIDATTCGTTPVWHIADLDPSAGVVPVNDYIIPPAKLCQLLAASQT